MTDRPSDEAFAARGAPRVAAIVLAAGAGRRFGGHKLTARLLGKPILQHVLDALADAGIDDPVVVLDPGDADLLAAIRWGRARRTPNPDPSRGLSSSLRAGWAAAMAAQPRPDRVLVALGDQPTVPAALHRRLLEMPLDAARPVIVARHRDGAPNPVRLEPSAAPLVEAATGDRGLGPLLERHAGLVRDVVIDARNPDVDQRADLESLVAAGWAATVRANAEQVERFRATPDGPDFYAPVTSMFVADPARRDDPVLDALLAIAEPGDTWLDIGAGAGRYALPLARAVDAVIAIDPSEAMLAALTRGAAEAGIANVRATTGRWPPDGALRSILGPDPVADVAFIAHVGYDVEAIVPFVDAMEAAARRRCVAVLMVASPAAVAAPFWPPVHGEARIGLPALPQFLELLAARGTDPEVAMIDADRRRWPARDDLLAFLRRQLWTAPGMPADRRLIAAMDSLAFTTPEGSIQVVDAEPLAVGIVSWLPRRPD